MSRKVINSGDVLSEDDIFEPEQDGPNSEEEKLFSDLGQLTGEDANEYAIKVYRIHKGNLHWLFNAHPTDLPELHEKLRDEYSGGQFEVRIYRNTRIFKRPTIFVEPPKKPAIVRDSSSENMRDMVQLVQNMMERQESVLSGALTQIANAMNNRPQVDPMQVQTQTLQMMLSMKQIFDGGKKEEKDPIEQLTKLMELKKGLDDFAGDTPPENKMLEQLGAIITGPLMQAGQAMPNAPKPFNPVQPAPMPVQPQTNQADQMKLALKMQIMFLMSGARNDSDPDGYASMIMDHSNQEQKSKLAALVSSPDMIKQLAEVTPDILSFKDWFEELGACLADRLGVTAPYAPPVDGGEDIDDTQPETTTGMYHAATNVNPPQSVIDGHIKRPEGDTSDAAINGAAGSGSKT